MKKIIILLLILVIMTIPCYAELGYTPGGEPDPNLTDIDMPDTPTTLITSGASVSEDPTYYEIPTPSTPLDNMPRAAQTGDETNMITIITLGAISLTGIIFITMISIKKKKI